MGDILNLSEEEIALVAEIDPNDADLVERVYDQFHSDYDTDIGRDSREFQKLLACYQAGAPDYRQGIDRALVTLTGYKLTTIIRRARGEDVG